MIGIKAKRYCYVCSPYRGNIFKRIRNRRYARELTERAINAGTKRQDPSRETARVRNWQGFIKCMRDCVCRREIRNKRRNGSRIRVSREMRQADMEVLR